MLRRKGASLIRNLWQIAKTQIFTRKNKALLAGMAFIFFSEMIYGNLPNHTSLSNASYLSVIFSAFGVSLYFFVTVKNKRTWIDEALGK